jgi:hypothetical protein
LLGATGTMSRRIAGEPLARDPRAGNRLIAVAD